MKNSTLYLHVGWSKTGTSAIQAQIQAQKEDFLEQGILYPQTLQWSDHSHHPFALSFQANGVYRSELSPSGALTKLKDEMESSCASSVLLSSELSPFYFNNKNFSQFVKENFSSVKVIFTVRCQSELILSLFNQLVKDPNVRYGSSLFALAMRNISWMNYYQNVSRWAGIVGKENISLVGYDDSIVSRFLSLFDISLVNEENESNLVNPSVPTRALALIQRKCSSAKIPSDFLRVRGSIIERLGEVPEHLDSYCLFSIAEQNSLDSHFKKSNSLLVENYEFDLDYIAKKDYQDIKVISPSFDF